MPPETLLPVSDALERIVHTLEVTPAEEVPVSAAVQRVTAAPVHARRTQPPVAVSAMDGYAVRASDVAAVPVRLKRVGSAPAGSAWSGTLAAGQAVRIFTGGPVPDGADTIVIQENVDAEAERDGVWLTVREGAPAGRYIRPAGLDFRDGDRCIAAGRVLTARDVGLAAAMNVPWLMVRRRPRIAVLSTGDEVVRPGEPLGPNRIVSSNSYALAAFIHLCGGEPVVLGIAPDTVDGLQRLARDARGCDMLLTTGGASIGEHDLVRAALAPDRLGPDGLRVDFWRIAMRPGKPLIFGHLGGTPMLGFPGNPVSTLVCGLVFLKPAIEAMLGIAHEPHPPLRARLGCDLDANDRRQDYLRSTLASNGEGERVATPFDRQDSSMLRRLAQADCLVVRPAHDPARSAGEWVEIMELPPGGL